MMRVGSINIIELRVVLGVRDFFFVWRRSYD